MGFPKVFPGRLVKNKGKAKYKPGEVSKKKKKKSLERTCKCVKPGDRDGLHHGFIGRCVGVVQV
jgi:hypothetical protein